MAIASNWQLVPLVISSGQSLSPLLRLRPFSIAGIVMPSGWDAAALTFQVSDDDGSTFNELYDSSGNEYTVQAAASRRIIVPLADFLAVGLIKLRSGTAASAVNQTADRSIGLILVP